jgi:hypothetical protein
MGAKGVILSGTTKVVGGATIDPSIENLSGVVDLRFGGVAPQRDSVKVTVLDSDGVVLVPNDAHYFTVRQSESEGREFNVSFDPKAGKIANQNAGRPFRIEVSADFGDLSAPTRIHFESKGSYYFLGKYWLTRYMYLAAALLLINLALVVGAIYSTWVRRLALDPTIRALVGIGIFKYLVTEPLLLYVPAVRRALFRDYRQRLLEYPQLKRWDDCEYIHPEIVAPSLDSQSLHESGDIAPGGLEDAGDGQRNDAVEGSNPIERVLDSLLIKKNSRRQLWLVEGQSGLGKSAFLQQIARAALRREITPLLLPLGSDQTPKEEVAALMSEYGDMNVSADTAMNIVDGGGFVVLIDALNEDRQPNATLDFARKARKRNLVLLSSQSSPSWPVSIPIERLNLAPFGREQLAKIIPDGWLDAVLEASFLSTAAKLPITALLLGNYISHRGELPKSDYAIYSNLSDGLNQSEALNLEQQAWDLFRNNEQQFKADARLTEDFCETAVNRNVLTRRSAGKDVSYRFVHERVHRFFVARYLVRQDETSLSKWHEKLDPGFGRGYWADVIEFLAATYAHSTQEIGCRTQTYTSFLRVAGSFVPRVFSDRLYNQYQRYRDAGEVLTDSDFQDWAASFLTKVISGNAGI